MDLRRCCALLAVLLLGCYTAPAPAGAPWTPPPAGSVRLPAGTRLELEPCRVVGASDAIDPPVVDGLWREALRQSAHFDVAGGAERAPSRHRLAAVVDAAAHRLSCSLLGDEGPARPLAAAGFADRPLHLAIDELAAETRAALGEVLAARPLPCAAIYSSDARCVRATERALRLPPRSTQAVPLLVEARRRDPGCTITLAALYSLRVDREDPREIARDVTGVLEHLGARTAPTTQHRLLRLIWLARGRLDDPAEADRKLLELAEVGGRERPHDPHPVYTRTLALGFLGRFAEAEPHLLELAERWPEQPWIGYHLAWAKLANGDPRGALDAIRACAAGLPDASTLLPRALAMFHAGEHDALRTHLAELADSRLVQSSLDGEHRLLRMQASLAILTGDGDAARDLLLDDLEWLRQRPSLLARFAFDLAEAGEVLVRLGAARELVDRLDAMAELSALDPTIASALTYVAGLAMVEASGNEPGVALRELGADDRRLWSTALQAAVHHRSGDIVAEATALAAAVRASDEPLLHATFARALRTLGREDDADALLTELRARLLQFDLRRPGTHPLTSPARALALLATER